MAVDPNFNWVRSLVQGASTENRAGTKWPTTVTGSTAGTDYLGLASGDLTVTPSRPLTTMDPMDIDLSAHTGSLYVLRQLVIQNLPTWTVGARVLEGEDFAIRYSSTVGRLEVVSMPQESSIYTFDVPTTGAYTLEVTGFSAWGYLTTGYSVFVNRVAPALPYYPHFVIYNSPPTRSFATKTGYTRVGGGGLDKTLTPSADFTITRNLVTQGYLPATSAVPQGLALAKDTTSTATVYPAISGRMWPPGLGYSVDIFPVPAASSTSTHAPSTYASGSITWRIGAGTAALPYFTATVNVAGLTWVQAATIAGQSLAAQVNAAFPALKPAVTYMSSSNEGIGTTSGSFSYSWAGGTWGGSTPSTFPGGSATGTRTGTIYRYYDMTVILLPLTGPTASWPTPEISYTDIVYSSGGPPYSAAFAPIHVHYSAQTVPATYGLGAGLPSTITFTITGASNADNGAAIMPSLSGSGTSALAVATTPSALDAANFFAGKLETEATSSIVTFGNTASLTLVTKSPMTVAQAMIDQVTVGRRVPIVSGVDRLYGFKLTLSKSEGSVIALPWPTTSIPAGSGGAAAPTVWDATYDTDLTYTNSSRTAAGTASQGFAKSVFSAATGLWYFEVTLDASNIMGMVGVGSPSAAPVGSYPGDTGTNIIALYRLNGSTYSNGTVDPIGVTAGDVIGVLFDASAMTVRWKLDSSTLTTAVAIPGTGPVHAIFGSGDPGTSVEGTLNSGQVAFVHGLPAGANPVFGDGSVTPSSDVTGAGYNDVAALTSTGSGSQQANFPDSYGFSSATLGSFTVTTVAYIDAADLTGTGSSTLDSFTCTADGVAADPTNMDGSSALDDFTCAADGVASTPTEFTANYALGDFTSLAVGLFLAPSEGSGASSIDAITCMATCTITEPETLRGTFTMPSPQFTATSTRTVFRGFVGSAPFMYATAQSGHRSVVTSPAMKASATATTVQMARAIMTMPMADVFSTGRVSGTAAMFARMPSADSTALGGHQAVMESPSMTATATGIHGGVAHVAARMPWVVTLISGYREDTGRVIASMPMLVPTPSATASVQPPMFTATARGHAVLANAYEAYVLNMSQQIASDQQAGAVITQMTRYTNWPFVQVVRLGDIYYGLAEDGLYELGGPTDNGTEIAWSFETCKTDFGDPHKKAVVSAYVGGQAGPVVDYTLRSGDDPDYMYEYVTNKVTQKRNHRQKFGLGRRVRYYSFGLAGTGKLAIDEIEFELMNTTRRI